MMVCASCGSEKVCRVAGTRLLCEECGKKRDTAIEKENKLVTKLAVVGLLILTLLFVLAKVSGCK